MKPIVSILACVVLSVALARPAGAADYKIGDIEITNTWARATPKGAQVGGAYMTITNHGTTSDRLVGGSSPVAGKLEFHEMTMDRGVMKMRPVKGGVEIKPGATVKLAPEAMHVMLVGLKQPLKQGARIPAMLEFAKAGKVTIEYQVESMGAAGPSESMAPMDHGMPANH
jgi:copper(I)-binding protein